MSAEQEIVPLSRTVPPMTFPKQVRVAKSLPSTDAAVEVSSEEKLDASSPIQIEQASTPDSAGEAVASRESTYQVVLEVMNPNDSRKRWLRNDQRLQIGRTSEADLSFPLDQRMSHLHFALQCDADACRLQDLGSCNGTLVNDVPVQRTILRDGDTIRAGDTVFRVHIHGGLPPSMQEVAAHTATDYVHQAPRNATPCFQREMLANGLLRAQSETAESNPSLVANRINTLWPLYYIVDLAKVNLAIPDELRAANRLFDWLPADTNGACPVLLPARDFPDIDAIIGAAWGCDAMVCLFTELETNVLLHLLRAAVRGERVRPLLKEHPDQLVGIYIPSVLATMLRTGPAEAWAEFFQDVNAVLLEGENGWELFLPSANEERLSSVGLQSVETKESPKVDSLSAEE